MKYKDFFKENFLKGGKGDNANLSKFDQQEVRMGLEVEKEHYVNIHPTTGQIILTEKEGDQLIIAAFPCNVIFFHLPLSLDPKI